MYLLDRIFGRLDRLGIGNYGCQLCCLCCNMVFGCCNSCGGPVGGFRQGCIRSFYGRSRFGVGILEGGGTLVRWLLKCPGKLQ